MRWRLSKLGMDVAGVNSSVHWAEERLSGMEVALHALKNIMGELLHRNSDTLPDAEYYTSPSESPQTTIPVHWSEPEPQPPPRPSGEPPSSQLQLAIPPPPAPQRQPELHFVSRLHLMPAQPPPQAILSIATCSHFACNIPMEVYVEIANQVVVNAYVVDNVDDLWAMISHLQSTVLFQNNDVCTAFPIIPTDSCSVSKLSTAEHIATVSCSYNADCAAVPSTASTLEEAQKTPPHWYHR